jgi:hypothetical protein
VRRRPHHPALRPPEGCEEQGAALVVDLPGQPHIQQIRKFHL